MCSQVSISSEVKLALATIFHENTEFPKDLPIPNFHLCNPILQHVEFSEYRVHEILRNLSEIFFCGLDGITIALPKCCAGFITLALSVIVQNSYDNSSFPAAWLMATIVLV